MRRHLALLTVVIQGPNDHAYVSRFAPRLSKVWREVDERVEEMGQSDGRRDYVGFDKTYSYWGIRHPGAIQVEPSDLNHISNCVFLSAVESPSINPQI